MDYTAIGDTVNTAARLEANAPKSTIYISDAVYEQVKDAVQATMDKWGQIDFVMANAGICGAGDFLNMPVNDWLWAVNVNLMGVVYAVRETLPILIKQGTPCHMTITASIAGLRAAWGANPPYAASKHAAVAVAEDVKALVEARGYDIGVSVYCPMYVHTHLDHCEEYRPERFWDENDPFYKSEDYIKGRETFKKNIEGGLPEETVGPRIFRAVEENQMYIVTHPVTIDFIKARHRAIEADAEYELKILAEAEGK
jgi:NAD(P)-dependent dehydrogenase (short-subunit alcohol dehydrogenase family)